jgi:hypothetical protein
MPSSRVLVVFVDAFGQAQLARCGAVLPFLRYRRGLRGVLGYSSGALPTVLTGASPSVHGRMCLFSRRRRGEVGILAPLSWLGLLPRLVHERAVVRRALGAALARAHGLTGYVALHRVPPEAFRWLELPERDDMFQAEAIGGARTFLADARRAGLSVYAAPWQLPEGERWTEALRALGRERPDLAFLYAAELDARLHERGNAEDVAGDVLERLAGRIARARELLTMDGAEVTTLVVGDHGMADVEAAIDPGAILAALGPARVFVDSTMMRLWGGEPALGRARRALEGAGIAGQWLDATALHERRAPTSGHPFGEAVWLLPEGAIFAPSFLGGRVRGMHGYDLGTPSSIAGLASDDPAALGLDALTDVAGLVRARLSLGAST